MALLRNLVVRSDLILIIFLLTLHNLWFLKKSQKNASAQFSVF